MLARLRHHGFVRGHDEHDEIDPPDAGEHVLHEFLVTGDVHERERYIVAVVGGQEREAEVDGDTALFFFFETVRIGSGQSTHERTLAVVDMPGGTDDDVASLLHFVGMIAVRAEPRSCVRSYYPQRL